MATDEYGLTAEQFAELQLKAEAIERSVRPPLIADMTMKNPPWYILPGKITYRQRTRWEKIRAWGTRAWLRLKIKLRLVTVE